MTVAPRPRGRPKSFHDKTAQNTVQALDRAMTILAALAETSGVTLTELAQRTGQSPATVYRVLTTLAAHRIVEADAAGQRWHIGAGAFRIGSGFLRRTGIVERSRAPMQALMRATGETANVGIESQDEVLFLGQVETHEAIRAFFPPGTKSPMHLSGIGKALLGWMPAPRVAGIVARRGLGGGTLRAIADAAALADAIAAMRAQGYAVDDEERAPGMRCVAAPVFDAHGEPVAGLSVSGPAFRLTPDKTAAVGAAVRQAAGEVTAAIGGTPPGQPASGSPQPPPPGVRIS